MGSRHEKAVRELMKTKNCRCIRHIRLRARLPGSLMFLKLAFYYLFRPNWVEGYLWAALDFRKKAKYHHGNSQNWRPVICQSCKTTIFDDGKE